MDIQKEREAFEEECRLLCYKGNMVMSNLGSFYNNEQTNWMWQMWLSAKTQAVPEGFVLVKKVHPDAIVHNQGLGLFKECQVIYGWDGKSKDFKEALNKGFYHGVKLGAKAVLETAMIEAQEPK